MSACLIHERRFGVSNRQTDKRFPLAAGGEQSERSVACSSCQRVARFRLIRKRQREKRERLSVAFVVPSGFDSLNKRTKMNIHPASMPIQSPTSAAILMAAMVSMVTSQHQHHQFHPLQQIPLLSWCAAVAAGRDSTADRWDFPYRAAAGAATRPWRSVGHTTATAAAKEFTPATILDIGA